MKSDYGVFHEPKFVPLKWLVAMGSCFVAGIGAAIYAGIWIQSMDSRLKANEMGLDRLQIGREIIIDKLDSIHGDLSEIKGIIQEMRRARDR